MYKYKEEFSNMNKSIPATKLIKPNFSYFGL